MRRKVYALAMVASAFLAGCSNQNADTKKPIAGKAVLEGTGFGYGGEMKVKVTTEDGKITDMELVSNGDTNVVIDRAFPLLKERIMEAQTPVVDSISGATFSSFGVKTAVADVFTQLGKDVEKIAMNTKGPETERKDSEEVKTQLVVVGGGPAGLSAAIEAKQNGVKDVIVIEKLDILSGNGKFDMDFVNIINTKAQKENGIKDSAEAFAKHLIEEKKVWDTEARVWAQANGAAVLDEWLREMGTNLDYNFDERNHMVAKDQYAGEVIQANMEKKAIELGVDIRTGTEGLDLIMEDGKAVGVKAKAKNNYYDIKAEAVIVATGGFCSNPELLKKYNTEADTLQTSNQMGTTGDFIPVFEKNDMALDKMDVTRIFPFINIPRRDLTGGPDGFILVNEAGNRFVDETKREKELATAIQTNGKVFYIYDQDLYENTYRFQKHNKLGYHTKADSLEELAKQLGIDEAGLKESVATFNKAVKGECKDPFREEAFTDEINANGPYYGVQVESAIHMTRGGVVANEKAQVLTNSGKVVEGLYAAGEVTASSQAYSAAVIFGRVSGEEAANFIKK